MRWSRRAFCCGPRIGTTCCSPARRWRERAMGATFHWRECALEALELASFMISALLVTALFEHPASPVRQTLPNALARRALIGLAMGLTGAAIVYSPWGRRSGAHFNPSVTLTFLRLGKITRRDAAGYIAAHFVGA